MGYPNTLRLPNVVIDAGVVVSKDIQISEKNGKQSELDKLMFVLPENHPARMAYEKLKKVARKILFMRLGVGNATFLPPSRS